MEDASAQGYGIIHWITQPLDLYFESLSRQIWHTTRGQPLGQTGRDLAKRWFSPGAGEVMGTYLEQWITHAPKFGRETTDLFIDRPLRDVDRILAGCGKRLELVQSVDWTQLSPSGRSSLDYFQGLEEFIVAFYESQRLFQESQAQLKAGELEPIPSEVLERGRS